MGFYFISVILGDTWLAQLAERVTLDLGVVSMSPCSVQILLKNKIFFKKKRKNASFSM